jgi:hypothetical protein
LFPKNHWPGSTIDQLLPYRFSSMANEAVATIVRMMIVINRHQHKKECHLNEHYEPVLPHFYELFRNKSPNHPSGKAAC